LQKIKKPTQDTLQNKPKAEVHPGHLLTGLKEEEEHRTQNKSEAKWY
jgi:hypothetical protein